MKRLTALATLAVGLLFLAVGGVGAKPAPPAPVTIQILNVSDWHGNLDPVANTGAPGTSQRAGSKIGSLTRR